MIYNNNSHVRHSNQYFTSTIFGFYVAYIYPYIIFFSKVNELSFSNRSILNFYNFLLLAKLVD